MGMSEMSEAMELQRRDDEAAMAAAISLKQFCENNECPDCIFNSRPVKPAIPQLGTCCLNSEPWDTPTKPFIQKFNKKYKTDFDA